MENKDSIILRINLKENQCEGRKWIKNLLKSKKASYACLKGGPISSDKLYPKMKAFIRLDGKLEYNNIKFDRGIQIQCKVINLDLRKNNLDPVDIELFHIFKENNRVNNFNLLSIGIDLIHGHRGHRYTDRGDEIRNHGLGKHKISNRLVGCPDPDLNRGHLRLQRSALPG